MPGYRFLSTKLKSYQFELKSRILPKTLLQLERYIEYPYYIKNLTTIAVFDEETALMLALNANNLQKYLDDLESHT